MSDERVLDPENKRQDYEYDVRLRPESFDEYIGQKRVLDNVELMVNSSLKRNAAMDHVLFSGPPGLGKTTLAMIISKYLGTELHVISGPAIEKKGDLAAILTNINPKDVLFIDEIHRMHITVEEILYSAMEDFRLDILIGQGASARTMQIDVPPFTLIGATTRSGLLSNPLRDRFMAHLHLDFYSDEELGIIVNNNAKKMSLNMSSDAILEIAKRSRGTPRIANRILRRVRDYCLVNEVAKSSVDDVKASLKLLDIDELGLDSMDRKILTVIHEFYNDGPVGIDALSATLGEDKQTIEEVYEPYLLKSGLLIRSSRGRTLTERSIRHITA